MCEGGSATWLPVGRSKNPCVLEVDGTIVCIGGGMWSGVCGVVVALGQRTVCVGQIFIYILVVLCVIGATSAFRLCTTLWRYVTIFWHYGFDYIFRQSV